MEIYAKTQFQLKILHTQISSLSSPGAGSGFLRVGELSSSQQLPQLVILVLLLFGSELWHLLRIQHDTLINTHLEYATKKE